MQEKSSTPAPAEETAPEKVETPPAENGQEDVQIEQVSEPTAEPQTEESETKAESPQGFLKSQLHNNGNFKCYY